MKPHYDVAEGPTWHSPRSGLVQQAPGADAVVAFGFFLRHLPRGSGATLGIYALVSFHLGHVAVRWWMRDHQASPDSF